MSKKGGEEPRQSAPPGDDGARLPEAHRQALAAGAGQGVLPKNRRGLQTAVLCALMKRPLLLAVCEPKSILSVVREIQVHRM